GFGARGAAASLRVYQSASAVKTNSEAIRAMERAEGLMAWSFGCVFPSSRKPGPSGKPQVRRLYSRHGDDAARGGARSVRRHRVGVTLVRALNARQKSLVQVKPHSSAMLSSLSFDSLINRMPFSIRIRPKTRVGCSCSTR